MRCAASVRQAYCRGRTISRRGIARACCLLIDGYRLRNHKCRVAAQSLRPRHRNNRRSGEKGGGLEPAIAAPRPRQRAHAADDRAPGISSGQASNRAASLFGSSGWLPSVDGIAVMSRVPRARCPIWGHVSACAGRAARDADGNWSLPRGRILPTHYERTVAAGARSATGIIPAKCALPHQRAFRSAEILPQRTTGTTPTSTSPTSPSLQNSVATVRGDAVEGSDVDLVVESSCPLGKGYDLTGLAG